MKLRRPQVTLAGLAGAGLLAVALVARDDEPGGAAPAAARAAQRTGRTAVAADVEVADLKLELLERPAGELPDPARNPFRFQARVAPPAPRASAAPGSPSAAAPQPPRPVAPSGPPPIPLRFIGLVDAPTQAGRVAIMSDGRGNVFHGKEGDIIEGRYRIGRVGADSLELSYTDGQGRQTIRLSGQ